METNATKLERVSWPKPCAVCGREVNEPGSYLVDLPDRHGIIRRVLIHDGCMDTFLAAPEAPPKQPAPIGKTPTEEDFLYDAMSVMSDLIRAQTAMQRQALEDIRIGILAQGAK